MSWLARLKDQNGPAPHPTKPTKGGFVGFVAPSQGQIGNFAETEPPEANGTALDPDRDCWPCSDAMTGAEIDRFTARLARFTDKGLSLIEAEALADRLVIRDRDGDDRRLCLECAHLSGRRCGAWLLAAVGGPIVSTALLELPQRCPAFDSGRTKEDLAAHALRT
ncbi:hypothetical protein ASC78_26010 [Variovorax sp. Root318D1]|uniref:hypothetical protein n=1 Tax=Variovorax sp. Root318D1 TaxID=1736513 RepID=UPI000701A946|nr:hypothetical protein [Variovorax sp. Root318D1]KQU87635.1 hypothetical protein ASC78_26010 [Variovorax sp. Root318D1]